MVILVIENVDYSFPPFPMLLHRDAHTQVAKVKPTFQYPIGNQNEGPDMQL